LKENLLKALLRVNRLCLPTSSLLESTFNTLVFTKDNKVIRNTGSINCVASWMSSHVSSSRSLNSNKTPICFQHSHNQKQLISCSILWTERTHQNCSRSHNRFLTFSHFFICAFCSRDLLKMRECEERLCVFSVFSVCVCVCVYVCMCVCIYIWIWERLNAKKSEPDKWNIGIYNRSDWKLCSAFSIHL
jgi:hypothetical protein